MNGFIFIFFSKGIMKIELMNDITLWLGRGLKSCQT